MIWQVERKQGIPKQANEARQIKASRQGKRHTTSFVGIGERVQTKHSYVKLRTSAHKKPSFVRSFPTICCDPYSYPINTNKTQREQDKPRQHKTRTNKTRVRERRHDRQDMQQPVVGPLLISDQSLTTTKAQKIVFLCDGPKKSLACISLWPNN